MISYKQSTTQEMSASLASDLVTVAGMMVKMISYNLLLWKVNKLVVYIHDFIPCRQVSVAV